MVTGHTATGITAEQRTALAQAQVPMHWPSLITAAVLAALATACWPWGFA